MRSLADDRPHASTNLEAVRSQLADRAASVHVPIGDVHVGFVNSGTGGLDMIDHASADQTSAAAALRFGLLLRRGFHHGSAERPSAWPDEDLHLAVLPAPFEVA